MSVEGIYKTRAVKGSEQWGPSASGHPQLVLQVGVEGQGIWDTVLVFSPDSTHFSLDRLKAMGWDGALWPDGHEWAGFPNLASIWGKDFKSEIKSENYQGTKRFKCEVRTGIQIEQFKPEARAGVAAQMKAMFAAPRPARKPRAAGSGDGGMPDDDYFGS